MKIKITKNRKSLSSVNILLVGKQLLGSWGRGNEPMKSVFRVDLISGFEQDHMVLIWVLINYNIDFDELLLFTWIESCKYW